MKIQTSNIYYKPMTFSPSKNDNGAKVSFASSETVDYYAEAKNRQQKARERVKNQRAVAFISALGLSLTGTIGTITALLSPKVDENNFSTPTSSVGSPFNNDFEQDIEILTEGNNQTTEETNPTIPETTVPVTEETIPETTVAETEPEIEETTEINDDGIPPHIEKIFLENPEVELQYNNLMASLETFSEHLGEDGLAVIKASIEKNGNGSVDPIDVLKILHIESSGRIYNKNGNYLVNSVGAMGPFQMKKVVEEDINRIYGGDSEGNKVNISNAYGNIDGFVLWWRYINEGRVPNVKIPASFPAHEDDKAITAWLYNQGAWSTSVSSEARHYVQTFDALSIVDKYPEVVEFILNGGE